MTEYDYSVEGYNKHIAKMHKIGEWVDWTQQFPPADPRTAATPATMIMAPLPLVEHDRVWREDSSDSDDDSHRGSRRDRENRRDRDRRDRRGRESPSDRRHDRDRARPSTSRPPPARSHTAPLRDRAVDLKRDLSSTSAGTHDPRHSGSSHDRAPAGRATPTQPRYPKSYPIYNPASGPYPYAPYRPDEPPRPHTSHHHHHHSLPGPAPPPPPLTPAPYTRPRQTRSNIVSAPMQPHIQTYIHPPPVPTPYVPAHGPAYPPDPFQASLHAQPFRPPQTGAPPVYPFRPNLSSPQNNPHATWHHHQQPPPPVRSQTHPHHGLPQPQPRKFKTLPPEPLLLPPVGLQYVHAQNQGQPVIPNESSGGMSPTKVPFFLSPSLFLYSLTQKKIASPASQTPVSQPHGVKSIFFALYGYAHRIATSW